MPRIRLLQTSDVHLRPDRPERLKALELVFAEARARSVEGMIIAGDLFDRVADAVTCRADVRRLVEGLAPRPVFLIPGNHDLDAYGDDADYGANAVVLAQTPFGRASIADLDVIGVPYQHGRTLAECLTGLRCDPRRTAIIAHGTIVDGIAAAFVGEGEEGAYLPIFRADLSSRSCYAALGHLHSGRNLAYRDGERLIAYAGSPVSTSRRELGPRAAVVVEIEPGVGVLSHEIVALRMPYYERVEVICTPGEESAAIDRLAREAVALRRPGARVIARLTGVAMEPEAALRAAGERALAQAWESAAAAGIVPARTGDDGDTSSPELELAAMSYAQLAEVAVVREFIERVRGRLRVASPAATTSAAGASATSPAATDAATLQAALRLGLGAFLESLP